MQRQILFLLATVLTSQSISAVELIRESIMLGSPELTSAISGSGPLKIEEIKAYLSDAKNHQPIDPQLPEGLDAGKDAVFIPEDNPMTRAKIELGRQLYFDKRLSSDATVSCADCHHPNHGYGFDSQFGIGVRGQLGGRNSPVSFNRILSKAQFWDGRASSLEAQAVGPIANPIEMANTHEAVVKFLTANAGYAAQFVSIFKRPPNIDDVGRAIATFERALVTEPSPYDYFEPVRRLEEAFAEDLSDLKALEKEDAALFVKYTTAKAKSDKHPMSEAAKRGRALFFNVKSNCSACHVGANFTDELYHNLGVGMDKPMPDLGRYDQTKQDKDRGAFKTPTLRNIAVSGPYMHDGSQKTLEEVIEWYAKGGHPNPNLSDKVKKLELSAQDKSDLVEFMKALSSPFTKVVMDRLPE
jgi:cytochrome c peroxidase